MLDLVRRIYPDVPAVFVDTGLEYPEIRSFATSHPNVVVLRPKMPFKQVIAKYGYPIVSKEQSAYISEYRTTESSKLKNIRWNGNKYGRGKISNRWKYLVEAPFAIGDKCCDVMKKEPCKRYEKQSGNHPFIATMANESTQRKTNWKLYGCNAFDKKRPTSQPMSFWTEQDVLQYLSISQIPYASVYGEIEKDSSGELHLTKEQRTGCMFCCYGINYQEEPNKFQRMKGTHPKQYDFCMRSIDKNGLGLDEVLSFMNVPH